MTRDFKLLVPPRKATGGNQPHRIAFSPDGTVLAVGYADAATVDLFDGRSLAPLPRPNVDGLRNGNLGIVTWSKDGKTLYAGGSYADGAWHTCSGLGQCGSRRAAHFASREQYSLGPCGFAGRRALGCCGKTRS